MEPLPSYGRGRELPGARYASFIHGNGLRDVVITGEPPCSALWLLNLLRVVLALLLVMVNESTQIMSITIVTHGE